MSKRIANELFGYEPGPYRLELRMKPGDPSWDFYTNTPPGRTSINQTWLHLDVSFARLEDVYEYLLTKIPGVQPHSSIPIPHPLIGQVFTLPGCMYDIRILHVPPPPEIPDDLEDGLELPDEEARQW